MNNNSPFEIALVKLVQEGVDALREADWNDPQGAIRFREDLTLDELSGARFFINTRLFLQALVEDGGTATTATGNLTRAFATKMFDRLSMSERSRESTRQFCKVINEHDCGDLHLARVVSQLAGLVHLRKNRFEIRPRGKELLSNEQAGALYRLLFITYFTKFDWHYSFGLRRAEWIQPTMAATLWRMDSVLEQWQSVTGLARKVLLPRVYENLRAAMTNQYDREEWIFSALALDPLLKFGLIENSKDEDSRNLAEKNSVRLTPLWKRFISFAAEPDLSKN